MTKQVVYDIETFAPYQQSMISAMEAAGKKPGEVKLYMSGRQTGKSSVVAYQRLWQAVMEGNAKVQDMQLGEGTVYGSRYYTVKPIGGNWHDMEAWCTQVFGDGSRALWGDKKAPEPARRWYMNNSKFWFKSEKDRDWFLVMWRS